MEQNNFHLQIHILKYSSFQHSPAHLPLHIAAAVAIFTLIFRKSAFRQSGLVSSLQAKIVFTEPFRNQDCIRGIEEILHHGLFGGFPKISVTSGHQPSARQDSAEIKEKEYLPVVRLSAQTLLDYPLYA